MRPIPVRVCPRHRAVIPDREDERLICPVTNHEVREWIGGALTGRRVIVIGLGAKDYLTLRPDVLAGIEQRFESRAWDAQVLELLRSATDAMSTQALANKLSRHQHRRIGAAEAELTLERLERLGLVLRLGGNGLSRWVSVSPKAEE